MPASITLDQLALLVLLLAAALCIVTVVTVWEARRTERRIAALEHALRAVDVPRSEEVRS